MESPKAQLPIVPPLDLIAARLPLIFPEGIEHRNYVIRDMAARTVFVMFYAAAVEGTGHWARPSQIMDMTDEQAALTSDDDRASWIKISLSQKKLRPLNTWYATNSREPVRDETIRSGLIPCRAVIEREGIATTSSKPRYALDGGFAALFSQALTGASLEQAISDWQATHLSKAALARARLVRRGIESAQDAVTVVFPNQEIRSLKPGPSSIIAKAVIESFAPKFLKAPAVLWLSESGNKVIARDESLAHDLGFRIDASKALPDIILIDMGASVSGADMVVVFVEVVATDGPIDRNRKLALEALAATAGFSEHHLAFLTAYHDRSHPAFRKTFSELAWGTFAWCVSEPDHIIELCQGKSRKLSDMRIPPTKGGAWTLE